MPPTKTKTRAAVARSGRHTAAESSGAAPASPAAEADPDDQFVPITPENEQPSLESQIETLISELDAERRQTLGHKAALRDRTLKYNQLVKRFQEVKAELAAIKGDAK